MAETPVSLLERLRDRPDPGAWQQLLDLYTPLLARWLQRQGLQPQDVEDLTQEILSVVVRQLPHFEHNHRRGAFRHWLRTILANCLRTFWRSQRDRAVGSGQGPLIRELEQLEDPHSELARLWDQEHDHHILQRLLQRVQATVTASTWQAFSRLVLQGRQAEEVAEELGLSTNAVLIAKSRVLQRLRRESRDLID